MTKKRPAGPYTQITSVWQERVRKELDQRGLDQKDLAKRLGASPAAISNMLAPEAKTSRLVSDVSLFLDIAPPVYEDDIDQELHEAMKTLRKRNRAAYDEIFQNAKRLLRQLKDDPPPGSTKPKK